MNKSAKALDGVQHGGKGKLKGTDCSGFVRSVFNEVFPDQGLEARDDLNAQTFLVSDLFKDAETPQPGDIICWTSHIGIVTGPASRIIIHAPGAGKPVRYQDWKWMPAGPTFRSWASL